MHVLLATHHQTIIVCAEIFNIHMYENSNKPHIWRQNCIQFANIPHFKLKEKFIVMPHLQTIIKHLHYSPKIKIKYILMQLNGNFFKSLVILMSFYKKDIWDEHTDPWQFSILLFFSKKSLKMVLNFAPLFLVVVKPN